MTWILIIGSVAGAALLAWGWRAARRVRRERAALIAIAQWMASRSDTPPPTRLPTTSAWIPLATALESIQRNQLQREQQLRSTAQQIEAVLSTMIEGVLAIEADRVRMANPAACTMLGLNRHHVIGRPLHAVVRNAELQAMVERARSTRTSAQTEITTLGPRRRTLLGRALPLTDPPPDAAGPDLVVVLYDVTDLRRLETMRRDFVANVSHELRTPLAAIKAYAETLQMGALDDPQANRHFVEQIEQHAETLANQIQGLLDLARVESGRTALAITDIDLADASAQCVRRFAHEAARRGVTLSTSGAHQPVQARGDAAAVQTILDNLVSNAIRFTPAGGHVLVRCAGDGPWGVIEVADTGIGIAPEYHARIFERFFRVDQARSREGGGSGLGLAIVKHTTLALGGTVDLESRVGKGSVFRVRLPLDSQATGG